MTQPRNKSPLNNDLRVPQWPKICFITSSPWKHWFFLKSINYLSLIKYSHTIQCTEKTCENKISIMPSTHNRNDTIVYLRFSLDFCCFWEWSWISPLLVWSQQRSVFEKYILLQKLFVIPHITFMVNLPLTLWGNRNTWHSEIYSRETTPWKKKCLRFNLCFTSKPQSFAALWHSDLSSDNPN